MAGAAEAHTEPPAEASMTPTDAKEAARRTGGLVKLLQIRRTRRSKEHLVEWICDSLASNSAKLHKSAKVDAMPDTLYSVLFVGIANDPIEILREKLEEKAKIWKCGSQSTKGRMTKVINEARAKALEANEVRRIHTGSKTANAAGLFKKNTPTGVDCWPVR